MATQTQTREERANLILKDENAIKRIDPQRYFVKSQSGNGEYEVISSEFGLGCSCPDHTYRGLECKHSSKIQSGIKAEGREPSCYRSSTYWRMPALQI